MTIHASPWWCALLSACLFTAPAWAQDRYLTADQAVSLALDAHPDLQAAELEVSSAEAARSRAAVLLSNPYAMAWFTPDGSRVEARVLQPFSLSGEGWHARKSARHAIEASEQSLDRIRRTLAADVRQAYIDAVVAVELVDVAREGAALAERLSFGVQRKLEEGEAAGLDLSLANLAHVQAATRLLNAQRAEAHALRALSSWVLVPVEASDLTLDPLSVAPDVPEDTSGERADVLAAEATLEAAQAQLRQARAATMPLVHLGVGVQVEHGNTYVGPAFRLALPIFARNQEGRAEALGALDIATSELQSTKAQAETEKNTSAIRLSEAESAASILSEAQLTEAQEALASIEAGVLAGQIDLATAVLLQKQVLDGEAALVQLRGLLAGARVDRLLALDNDLLLGGAQ